MKSWVCQDGWVGWVGLGGWWVEGLVFLGVWEEISSGTFQTSNKTNHY